MDLSKFENQCAVLVCCLLAAALIQGCGMSHRATPDAGSPPVMGDAGAMPVTDSAPPAADAGPSFYEWPDTGPVPTPVDAGTDAFVEPDAYVAPLGRYEFCDPWTADIEHRGGFRGCCAVEGSFPTSDHVEPGMLVKGSGSPVYYIANDGRRYIFATSQFLSSWYLDSSRDERFGSDSYACSLVTEIPDALLASIRIGGNVPMRPGVVTAGIITDPRRYVIDHGNVLRRIGDPTVTFNLAEPWLRGRDILISDAFFVTFCIGTEIWSSDIYDGDALYREATIQYEIDHYCGG